MLGMLLLGMVIGAVVYNSFYVARLEALMDERSNLVLKLEQYKQDINGLKQFKNQHTVIKSIVPRIENDAGEDSKRPKPKLDQVTEAKLIKLIKKDLSSFLGKSIYEIDSDAQLARRLLNRMLYLDVYGKDYTIEVKTILVADNVLHVWVIVDYYTKPPS